MRPKQVCILLMMTVAFLIRIGDAACAENITHVSTTLTSPFLRLDLDANVILPSDDAPIPVFSSDYASINDVAWREMFFGDANSPVVDELAGMSDAELKAQMIFDKTMEHAYSAGDVFTRYVAHEARICIVYQEKEFTPDWLSVQTDAQADGLQTTSVQAMQQAQAWIDQVTQKFGWNGFVFSECYTFPLTIPSYDKDNPQQIQTGFYMVEFARTLAGIPIAYDTVLSRDSVQADITGDRIQLFIDDSGIFYVAGYCRSYTQQNADCITVSLDDAIAIVKDNMDYVEAYRNDSTFSISQIELCYRLVQQLDISDKDAYVRTLARPAWRFASAINRNNKDQFVIFVDAITGDILP